MTVDVLIVDDEADIREIVAGILQDEGYRVVTAGGSVAALEAAEADAPPVVILDVWLEGSPMDGVEVLEALRDRAPDAVVLMMSGHADIETAVKAIQKGAYDFIEKPFAADRMIISVARAFETATLRRENADLRSRSRADWPLVGGSAAIKALSGQIAKLAQVNSRVLISGPSGSGKEVIARRIHAASPRAAGPFVAISCAGMRPDSVEAMLFGEQIAEGVVSPGLLQNADKGVILLDEVADMPLETQAKMLRMIQDQTFTPVGGSEPRSVDVRVLASTAQDLQELVEAGRFREDLFFRLSVVPIAAPPLAQRIDDIPELVEHFVDAAVAAGQTRRKLSDAAIAALQSHAWPGNVRQLRNVVEWLLIMAPGGPEDEIGPEALPPDILREDPGALMAERRDEVMTLPLKEAREAFERNYLSAQIARSGGNISKTAKLVGMERSALHRKLRSLGVGVTSEGDA